MKKTIQIVLAIFILLLLSTEVSLATSCQLVVSASPDQFIIERGKASSQNIVYNLSYEPWSDCSLQLSGDDSCDYPSVSSDNYGTFYAGSTIIGKSTQKTLFARMCDLRGQVSESLYIPVAISKRAEELGVTQLVFERWFGNDSFSVYSEVYISISTGTASEFSLSSLRLYFENNRADITIKRNEPLKAYAEIAYTGSGLLEGYWEVDGRRFSDINMHITHGKVLNLETPDIPPIPTSTSGSHTIRLVITNPHGTPVPEALFFVSQDAVGLTPPVVPLFPKNNASLEYQSFEFTWDAMPKEVIYMLDFYVKGEEKPFFSAYTEENVYTIPEYVLKSRFSPDKAYLWEIKVLDKDGKLLREGPLSAFFFR